MRRNSRSVTVEIRSTATDGAEVWRVAELSSNPKCEDNVISQKLVTNVLGEPIHPLDKERVAPTRTTKHRPQVEGYVEVAWCLENAPRRIHGPMRFLVSSTYDPPYDAVLGRRDSVHYGIDNLKSQ